MKRLEMLSVAVLLVGILLPAPANAQTETTVTGAGAGIFPPGASFNGVPLSALKLGTGLTIASSGSAEGQFQTTLIGISALGLEQSIQVEGKAGAGSSSVDTASFWGQCTVDMGDGTPPLPNVPFTAIVATNANGTGSLTLTLATTNLPVATVNEGSMTIK